MEGYALHALFFNRIAVQCFPAEVYDGDEDRDDGDGLIQRGDQGQRGKDDHPALPADNLAVVVLRQHDVAGDIDQQAQAAQHLQDE